MCVFACRVILDNDLMPVAPWRAFSNNENNYYHNINITTQRRARVIIVPRGRIKAKCNCNNIIALTI